MSVGATEAREATAEGFGAIAAKILVDHAIDAFYLLDEESRVLDVNRHACESLGYSREELIGMHPRQFDVGFDEKGMERMRQRIAAGEVSTFETYHRRKDGGVFPVEIRSRHFEQAGRRLAVNVVRDITERKRAEEERLAHVRFMGSLDRLNQAMQGTNDIEQMMSDALDAVLEILDCDRAWLMYPCNATAPSYRIAMERTRPEFPGARAQGIYHAQTGFVPAIAAVLAAAHGADPVVSYGPEHDVDILRAFTEQMNVKSRLLTAIFPKIGEPYLFGLHQCSRARTWTPHERRLFQEIGRRLADALTTRLMLSNLRESARKLDEAQRIAHVGYWDRDFETGRVSLSEEGCRIFGVALDDRVLDLARWHERWLNLIHHEDQSRVAAAAEAALREGIPYDVEYRVVHRGGDIRIIHSRGEVQRNESGRPWRMFGIMQDITELKRTERRLLAHHSVTRIFAEAATLEDAMPRVLEAVCEFLRGGLCALWRIDSEASVLRCVEQWRRPSLAGAQGGAAIRTDPLGIGSGLPGRVWATRAPIHVADTACADGLRGAVAFPILLGSEVLGVIECLGSDIREPDADLKETIETIGSQTGQFLERKRAESALQLAHAKLAHATRVMTLGELTASIAHEVNQPLGAMVTSAGACARWLAAQPPDMEKARRALERIVKDGRRASAVVERVRALVKRQAPRTDWLDLNAIVLEVIALAQHELHRNKIVLQRRLAEALPPLRGDRVQLQQVLLNLVANAIEAMSKVDDRPRELTVVSAADGPGAVQIEVQDSGTGIDRNSAAQLFEPFYTTKAEGLGIGLSISRSIVEAHGGRLSAGGRVPHGAVFRVSLPLEGAAL